MRPPRVDWRSPCSSFSSCSMRRGCGCFFGANNSLLGVINIIPQFLVILATVVGFYRLDRMAAWCLVPLAVWVAFAGVLNVAIWRLNG